MPLWLNGRARKINGRAGSIPDSGSADSRQRLPAEFEMCSKDHGAAALNHGG